MNDGDAYTVVYTGSGDVDNQLTQGIVRTVLSAASAGNKTVTGFVIPDGVEKIGGGAFNNQTGLKTIEIPNSVTSISYAFQNCSSLEEFIIPESVTSCHTQAFSGCTNLRDIKILGRIEIGTNMFLNFGNLESVEISGNVTKIDYGAFANCSNLRTVKWPEKASFDTIGNRAFMNCTMLEGPVNIPNGVTTIGGQAFMNCKGIEKIEGDIRKIEGGIGEINLPDSVTTIGGSAFMNCSVLTSIKIPNSVRTIVGSAFEGCSMLERIVIPEGVGAIENSTFSGCTALETITIPSSVTKIGNAAFRSCKSLTSIKLPSGLTSIGQKAFSNCTNLKSITIPTSVTEIGYRLFGFVGDTYPDDICGVKSVLIYPDDTNNGEQTMNALIAQKNSIKDINVFVVNGDDDLEFYRGAVTAAFGHNGEDEKIKKDDGSVALTNVSGTITTDKETVEVPAGARVSIDTDGNIKVIIGNNHTYATVTDNCTDAQKAPGETSGPFPYQNGPAWSRPGPLHILLVDIC